MTCHCGTEFEPKMDRQLYCSRRCNSRAAGRRREKIAREQPKPTYYRRCAWLLCGKRFQTKSKLKIFHSSHCAQVASQKTRRACRAAELQYAQAAAAPQMGGLR